MRIDLLTTFRAILEEGGFAPAAEALGITQPAVTYRLQALEESLGVELLERPRRPLIPSPAGRRLLDEALPLVDRLHALGRDLVAGVEARLEPLRVAAPGAYGRFVVFPVLSEPDFSEVPVELLFRRPEEIFERVESGDSDVGVTYVTRTTSRLIVREVGREEFILIVPTGSDVQAEALTSDTAFVTYEECDYVFGSWFAAVVERRPATLRSVARFERLEEVVAGVAQGRGMSIVPRPAARDALAQGLVAEVPTRSRCFNRNYALTRPGWTPLPDAERLVRALRARDPA